MLKQGQLTSEMSPTKLVKNCQTPNAFHVLSTPAHAPKGGPADVPHLNWDLSMIDKSDENKELIPPKSFPNKSVRKPRPQPVEIKSKYMQSASKRKTPASTIGKTPLANRTSNRKQIEELKSTPTRSHSVHTLPVRRQLNRENTFTFESKEPGNKSAIKAKPRTPQAQPTIRQSIGSDRKVLRKISKEISATPQFGKRTVVQSPQSLFNHSPEDEERRPSVSAGGGNASAGLPVVPEKRTNGVSEADLQILHHQKLQMLYILSKLENTQDSLSTEASCQLYQRWKVKENLRSDCSSLELDCLVKEYLCSVNEMCDSILPVCTKISDALPRFDKDFVTLCSMLDSTRHYVNTVNISPLTGPQVEELQKSLKQVLEMVKSISYDASDEKENILEDAEEVLLLRRCYEDSVNNYEAASKLAQRIKETADENLFLTATMTKIDISRDVGEDY